MSDNSTTILGVRVDNYTPEEALHRAEQLIKKGGAHYIVTPNPEIVLRAHKDEDFKKVLNGSSLSLCDGTGLYFAAYFSRNRLRKRICGADFMEALCVRAQERGWSIALVGAKEPVREKVRAYLKMRYPQLRIIQREAGNAQPLAGDIVFVAFGAPKQERWMAEYKKNFPHTFCLLMGVGGAFDMLSGVTPRAPRLLRAVGVEWLWRLMLEPRRARRIFGAVILFPLVCMFRAVVRS